MTEYTMHDWYEDHILDPRDTSFTEDIKKASGFEAQCDCELDSPGTLPHLTEGERLLAWTEWALSLKTRIGLYYRPRIFELKRDNRNLHNTCNTLRENLAELQDKLVKEVEERAGIAILAEEVVDASRAIVKGKRSHRHTDGKKPNPDCQTCRLISAVDFWDAVRDRKEP